jgi:SAM-dependent methyltransferase
MNTRQRKPHSLPACKACHNALNPDRSLGNKNGYDLLRCEGCGTVTVDPFPTPEELTAFYQSYKGTTNYRAKEGKKIARATRRIARLREMTPGKTFLDVGCNYGFTVKAALSLGLDAKGIDIDETAVNASRESFGAQYFQTIAVQDYAHQGHKADIIYTSEVIEHVPDPDAFVDAIANILSPGGVLYLTTPEAGHWRIPRNFLKWDAVMPPEHITYFTRLGITRLLNAHGLTVEKFYFSWKPGMRLVARKADRSVPHDVVERIVR